RQADLRRGLAAAQKTAKFPVRDDIGALRRNAFVVEGIGAESGTVIESGVGDDMDEVGAVAQVSGVLEREKAGAGEVGFGAEHAVELDRMADRFVNLQSHLRAVQD